MSAASLYQALIVNPTKNMDWIRGQGHGRLGVMRPTEVLARLRPETKLKSLDARQFDQQFDLDAAMWFGAIATGPASGTILRLFHMFYHAGIIYKQERGTGGYADWSDNNFGNLASLLSHGGRVMVQIPTLAKGGGALWTWLNQDDDIRPRGWATHGLTLKSPVDIFRKHKLALTEEHGAFQSLKGHLQGRHFAFNVALGGEGNMNPFSASTDLTRGTYKPVKADGLNGHVYLNYLPPTQTSVGGLLVGCENAEHGKGKNPHTKAGHGLGGSQKVSATGGKKWTELGCGPKASYGGLICDLVGQGNTLDWLFNAPMITPETLDAKTVPVCTLLNNTW